MKLHIRVILHRFQAEATLQPWAGLSVLIFCSVKMA